MNKANKVIWSEKALQEFERIIDYCRLNFGRRTALNVGKQIKNDVRLLLNSPFIGRVNPQLAGGRIEYRMLLSSRQTWIVYSIHSTHIYIHLLWDTRREPSGLPDELKQE